MENNLNTNLAEKIFEKIPPNVKPIEYLMTTLDLARESVYRRKRGELSFSIKEIVKLSQELNFSIDEIIGTENQSKIIFDIQNNAMFSPEETFRSMLEEYFSLVKRKYEAHNVETIITQNQILPIFVLKFKHLFKFFYYKWMHQGYRVPLNFYYADIKVPVEILNLKDDLIWHINQINNYIFIIDPNTYIDSFKEVLYYYDRKLISKEDLFILKEEFVNLLRHTESLVLKGTNDHGLSYQFYLSSLNVESNTFYVKYDDKIESFLWLYYVNPVKTNNKRMCATHKRWIDSMKRYSSLITHSNELLQAKFYNEQYNYIEQVSKRIFG